MPHVPEGILLDVQAVLKAVTEDGRAHSPTCGLDACVDCWRESLAGEALEAVTAIANAEVLARAMTTPAPDNKEKKR